MRNIVLANAAALALFAAADSGKGGKGSPPPAPKNDAGSPPPADASNIPVGSMTPGSNPGTDAADAPPAGMTTDGGTKPRAVGPITSDVPPPIAKRTGPRAGTSLYDFDKLEINQSFGVLDKTKTAKKFASTVTAANHRFDEVVKDANGATVMIEVKGRPIKDANGNITGTKPNKMVPKVKATRKFIVADVDPATDPHGASVRVWRVALPDATA